MGLAPGQSLLHYELIEKIGAGGMGVVYRATDTKLRRDVAIKVLPDDFAEDSARLARFEREAHILASLNHSGIASIHGLEESNNIRFLVLELVPGETLADRLMRGPLPIDEALTVARQIAEALEEAHERGVIHRDLKPANIKLTPEGNVKVLDFGLAKALASAHASDGVVNASHSPTLTSDGTRAGVILGTAAYMSPEQARGKPLDRRTDLWSFGCVLYECLTGRQLFRGETVSDSLAAILHKDPDWAALPKSTPPRIRLLLRRLLTRTHGKRLRDAGDARLELEEALDAPDVDANIGAGNDASTSGRRGIVRLSAVAIAALAVGAWLAWSVIPARTPPGDELRVTRFTVPVPSGTTLGGPHFGSPVALSPDGRTLVFQADAEGEEGQFIGWTGSQLYRRDLDRFESAPIPNTTGATTPFFSPDGRWLGFWADGELRKTQLAGGRPITIVRDIPSIAGAHWTDDDMIFFGGGLGRGILKVPAAGGEASVVTKLDVESDEIIHGDPHVLPGGSLLFSASGGGTARVFVTSGTTERRHLLDGGSARVLANGQLLFSDEDALRVAAFDAVTGRLTGDPLPLLDSVEFVAFGGLQSASVAVARQGTMAYALRPQDPVTALTWIHFDGKSEVRDVKPAGAHWHVRVSPDGTRLATSMGHDGIWVTDIATGAAQPIWQRGAAYQPRWSPDGETLLFKLNGNLAVVSARGGEEPKTLLDLDGYLTPFSWSAGGEISFVVGLDRGSDILILGADGTVREFRATEATETNPEISPDGRWLAYVSDVAGTPDVYIAALDGSQGQCAVTRGGGYTPAWSTDSRRLYYARNGSLWVAELSGASCRTENHRQLIDAIDIAKDFGQRHWDLLPDERGIVFVDLSGRLAARAREIHVVLNGIDEIERVANGN